MNWKRAAIAFGIAVIAVLRPSWAVVAAFGAIALAGSITVSVLASELEGWMHSWSRSLVDIAAARLGEDTDHRYRTEWLAELTAFRERPVSALLWALSLNTGVRSLRHQLTGRRATRRATLREEITMVGHDVFFVLWRVICALAYLVAVVEVAVVVGVIFMISGSHYVAIAAMLGVFGLGATIGLVVIVPIWLRAWIRRIRETERSLPPSRQRVP